MPHGMGEDPAEGFLDKDSVEQFLMEKEPTELSLTFDDYQRESFKTAVYPDRGDNFIYPTLGLVGEAGELANKVKKVARDHGGIIDEERKRQIVGEMGDLLWYIAALASELHVSLGDVAESNMAKCASRRERGVIQGSGDDR